jgi:hypothetical protein
LRRPYLEAAPADHVAHFARAAVEDFAGLERKARSAFAYRDRDAAIAASAIDARRLG